MKSSMIFIQSIRCTGIDLILNKYGGSLYYISALTSDLAELKLTSLSSRSIWVLTNQTNDSYKILACTYKAFTSPIEKFIYNVYIQLYQQLGIQLTLTVLHLYRIYFCIFMRRILSLIFINTNGYCINYIL